MVQCTSDQTHFDKNVLHSNVFENMVEVIRHGKSSHYQDYFRTNTPFNGIHLYDLIIS